MLQRFNSVLLHDTLPVDLPDLWPPGILILAFLVFNPGNLYYLGYQQKSNTINLLFKTAISILIISNYNSFQVLFDNIASVYFSWKIYLYILAQGTKVCPYNWHNWVGHFNGKILIYFPNENTEAILSKQHSETVTAWNYQNADCIV